MAVRDQHVADPISVRYLIDAATATTPSVDLVIVDIVRKEFHDKLDAVTQYVGNELRRPRNEMDGVRRGLDRIRQLADKAPIVPAIDDEWVEQAAQRSLDLAKELLGISSFQAIAQEHLALAHSRMMRARPPAQRGSVSTVDS
jgi:hypothetical protein